VSKTKEQQAAAYRKWRDSPKGKAYRIRVKLKRAGLSEEEIRKAMES
jgi:hypothetical protein